MKSSKQGVRLVVSRWRSGTGEGKDIARLVALLATGLERLLAKPENKGTETVDFGAELSVYTDAPIGDVETGVAR